MPIDPNIPLMVRPPEQADPMSALARVLQLNALRQEQTDRQTLNQQRELQIAGLKRQQAGRDALSALLKTPEARDAAGEVNHRYVADQLGQQGFPDEAEAWLSQSAKNVDSLAKFSEARKKAAEAAQEAIGGLAQTASTPHEFIASLGILASQGILDEQTARSIAEQADQAGPDGWKGIRDQYVHLAPSYREAALKAKAATEAPQKLRPGETFGVPGQPPLMTGGPEKRTNEQAALDAYAKSIGKQTAEDLTDAERVTYEKRQVALKHDPVEAAAQARAARQLQSQIDAENRRQDFAERNKGRSELSDKIEPDWIKARNSVDELRDTVKAAQGGNKMAAQLTALQTTMASIRSQGLNRINAAEVGQTQAAGSLWDRIQGRIGSAAAGQPMSADLQKDILAYADLLEKGAYKNYRDRFSQVVKRYKLEKDEQPLPGPDLSPAVPKLPAGIEARIPESMK